ncbi:hypothetical protein [Streptomyces luteogriseus]|uniref:hypothetical protein n=1 Tax=Streptomyces luteogriseus TaxID=68233 RepID=UPI00378F2D5C
MDLTGKKQARLERLLEEQRKHYGKALERLRGDLRFMIDNATDEQLVHWARESAKKFAEHEEKEPDWERRHADHLANILVRMQQREDMVEKALNDQDWDIKIFAKDGTVNAVGTIDREQVPALMYRLAERYAGEELGTSIEQSLRFEVTKYLDERNEARDRLARIAEAHSKDVSTAGMTSGRCIECGERDPCPTHVWATTERHPVFNTWDPADDEEVDAADE